jgi:hypothetical protein
MEHHQGHLYFSASISFFGECGVVYGTSAMHSFNSEKKSINLNRSNSNYVSREELRNFDLDNQLIKLGLLLAQTWRDNHPDAQPGSESDLDECTLAVAIEMTIAGEAVGGQMGALISEGAGVSAACVACRRVL